MGEKFEAEGGRVERRDGQKGEKTARKKKARLKAFYNNKFNRDAKLLTILKKREAEMEGNMLKRI